MSLGGADERADRDFVGCEHALQDLPEEGRAGEPVRSRPGLVSSLRGGLADSGLAAQGRLVYCGNDTECALLILAGQVLHRVCVNGCWRVKQTRSVPIFLYGNIPPRGTCLLASLMLGAGRWAAGVPVRGHPGQVPRRLPEAQVLLLLVGPQAHEHHCGARGLPDRLHQGRRRGRSGRPMLGLLRLWPWLAAV